MTSVSNGSESRSDDDFSEERNQEPSYAKIHPRISKEDFFAIIALWMERFSATLGTTVTATATATATNPPFGVNQAGAVFVDARDRIVAMDCTRAGNGGKYNIHAAARVLINFPDKVKGCTVYMSRKPCSFCVKLLVQAEVSRIRFLPFQPEASPDSNCSDLDNAERTENLLRVCPVGLSMHVPKIDEDLQSNLESSIKKSHQKTHISQTFKNDFKTKYWSDKHAWVLCLKEIASGQRKEDIFRCSGLADQAVIDELTNKRMDPLAKWISTTTVELVPDSAELKSFKATEESTGNGSGAEQTDDWELERHMSRMSLIISRRTDDPDCSGVGVILLMKNQVVSVGLNGFPSKAMFGDFPRNEESNPYLIHAEQNALLLRNTRNIEDESTTAFISEAPCDDCIRQLVEVGVRKVVLPWKPGREFATTVEELRFEVFYFEKNVGVDDASRNLFQGSKE